MKIRFGYFTFILEITLFVYKTTILCIRFFDKAELKDHVITRGVIQVSSVKNFLLADALLTETNII